MGQHKEIKKQEKTIKKKDKKIVEQEKVIGTKTEEVKSKDLDIQEKEKSSLWDKSLFSGLPKWCTRGNALAAIGGAIGLGCLFCSNKENVPENNLAGLSKGAIVGLTAVGATAATALASKVCCGGSADSDSQSKEEVSLITPRLLKIKRKFTKSYSKWTIFGIIVAIMALILFCIKCYCSNRKSKKVRTVPIIPAPYFDVENPAPRPPRARRVNPIGLACLSRMGQGQVPCKPGMRALQVANNLRRLRSMRNSQMSVMSARPGGLVVPGSRMGASASGGSGRSITCTGTGIASRSGMSALI